MEKGKLIITCKKDIVYHGVAAMLGRTYLQLKTGETEKPKAIERRVMSRFKSGLVKLNVLRQTMEKEWGKAIEEGHFIMYQEYDCQDGGGKIVFEFEGSKEELDRWLKVRTQDKIMLKLGVNKLFDYEVVRSDR